MVEENSTLWCENITVIVMLDETSNLEQVITSEVKRWNHDKIEKSEDLVNNCEDAAC